MHIAVKLKKSVLFVACIGGILLFEACSTEDEQSGGVQAASSSGVQKAEEDATDGQQEEAAQEEMEMKINVQIGTEDFTATLENNETAAAFAGMMREGPVVIQMSDYSGFEKVGALGMDLPVDDYQITAQCGDIVLYNGNRIVLFYGSNSWSYTRVGRIDDLTGWEEALGSGDVTVTFQQESSQGER